MIYEDNENYIISRINIDSKFIKEKSKPIIDSFYNLDNSPFIFTKNSSLIKIKISNEIDIILNSYISLFNIEHPKFIMSINSMNIIKNSNIIRINHPNHNFTEKSKIKLKIISKDDFINLIPINYFINKIFKINIIDVDNYSIEIDFYPTENILNDFLYLIFLINPNDINLNLLNTDANKYHKVINIIEENKNKYISIDINKKAITDITYLYGDNIKLGVLKSLINDFNINNYQITFNKTYYNVEKIKLVSTLFPNFESLIHFNLNHKFYWMYLDDPKTIYEIELSTGYVDFNCIRADIIHKINNTLRNYSNLYDNLLNQLGKYCFVNINMYNNKFIFEFLNNIYLKNAFSVIQEQNFPTNKTIIKINQPYHNLCVNNVIHIENSNNYLDIPSSILNGHHKVYKVIDANNYLIKLKFFNPLSNSYIEDNIIKINYPVDTKILFYENHAGEILGFSNINETLYSKIIKSNNLDINLGLNSLKTCNYIHNPYIFMASSIFSNEINVKESVGIIAKLYLNINNDPYTYDRFMQLNINLPTTYHSINQIDFKFLKPDGELFNFNNLHHSFVIELYEKKIK